MKTIEEAIDQAIQKFLVKAADDSLRTKDEVCDVLCDFSNYIMSLPLSERITSEEREKIKSIYADAHPEDPGRSFASLCVTRTLEDIFGKSMFAEEGGSNE